MKKIIPLILTICLPGLLLASDGYNYPVSAIPAKLLEKANAVVRYDETVVDMVSLSKVRYYNKRVVTILNEKGAIFNSNFEFYDKSRKVEKFEGVLYDKSGQKIRSIKKADIADESATSGGTLADDARVKHFSFYHKEYPYTVEFETELIFYFTYSFPRWIPQVINTCSVEQSSILVKTPRDYELRYKTFNKIGNPVITQTEKEKEIRFQLNNLPAFEDEYASPEWYEQYPLVIFSPSRFEYEGYKGDMTSWKEYGNFSRMLNKGRDVLPDNIKAEVHKLTDHLKDPYQKIDVLYKYMQANTRYVSIQLGIGGLQPFDAKFVAEKKYGDCKALSNYMYSLLKEAGIPSCYTLAQAGKGKKFSVPDFPRDYFNHIILAVPLSKDTVWLECTSQTLQTGYLSDFTDDRYVLMITDDGGKLVKTPAYSMMDNTQTRVISAKLLQEGALGIHAITSYRGLQQEKLHNLIHYKSRAEQEESLKKEIDLPNYNLDKFTFTEKNERIPEVKEDISLSASGYVQVSGKRLFISPNIMNKTSLKLVADSARVFDVVLNVEFRDTDSVDIEIPEGYSGESIPAELNLVNKFGKYRAKYSLEGNHLKYVRVFESNSGRFPPGAYEELRGFYEKLYKADRTKIVLVKKE